MKIARKIILSDAFHLALIAVIGIFAIQSLNSIFTKLRFVEIADNLNATFLEMRLSEKNYFLYQDKNALENIEQKVANSQQAIDLARNDILRAIGPENMEQLERYLSDYSRAVATVKKSTVEIDTKLRFVEIADNLNATFLEMRLSEKNYFLYQDKNALENIEQKVANSQQAIDLARNDILRAIGPENMEQLERYLSDYSRAVTAIKKRAVENNHLEMRLKAAGKMLAEFSNRITRLERTNVNDILSSSKINNNQMEKRLRAEGKKLEEFSDRITRLERTKVNEIISSSKIILVASFFAVIFSAFVIGHLVSRSIVRPIKEVEKLANSISAGSFTQIYTAIPRDETGSVIQAINTMSKELKHREEQIIQSKKLASIGILVAGVAHELNNPLNNISLIAQTYTELYDKLSEEQRIEFVGKIEGETERIKGIVKNLLDFAKPKKSMLEKANVNVVINKTLKLMQNILDVSNINVKLSLASNLPAAFLDQNQIQQVFVNMIVNAVQAMSAGGTLTISTKFGREPDTVEVVMRDTGKGIPQEFLPHIFDPFFSTKEDGGTGLGLWVSYGIIKQHGGNILVESKPGVETVFTVQLPVYRNKGENV